jgi:hypothetical protein
VWWILKPIIERWGDEGLIMFGHAVNNIRNCVKVFIYEGADKYDQFSERKKEIRKQMVSIVESGIEVHGRTFPVRELIRHSLTRETCQIDLLTSLARSSAWLSHAFPRVAKRLSTNTRNMHQRTLHPLYEYQRKYFG